ncbi:MAG: 1,4-dihydroxy-2-naphthoate octaprenyltransferase [Sedimentisphaerales bacterium]|nr:1,4-dihydroxy-2-naphthoate octaprenyltransferase [Sedimentisphaerales bacterium]
MKHGSKRPKLLTLFLAARPKHLVAGAAPVIVGSCLGYATLASFNIPLFVLALVSIILLQAGANMANDYFDHVSGNDWANKNPTPFSGGSRFIQQGLLTPKAMLLAALAALAFGCALGVVILMLTRSLFILVLGLIGVLGGFFYTASPIKLGYRTVGEFMIFLLFGLLPVYGAYYLQTERIDAVALVPGILVGILIFLIILVNEFPDVAADAAVNKRTLIVAFGVSASAWIYRVALIASFVIAIAAAALYRPMFYAGLLYMLTLPAAVAVLKALNKDDLVRPGQYKASQITVLIHTIGSLTLAAGFIISGIFRYA